MLRRPLPTDLRQVAGLLAVLLAGWFAMTIPVPGLAQEGETISPTIPLSYENEDGEDVPVEGVRILFSLDGEQVGEVTTDADGNFVFPVPGPGSYDVTVDPESLPEGISLANPDRATVSANVLEGGVGRVIIALVSGDGASVDTGGGSSVSLRAFLQLTTEGIKLGLFLAMAAIGLSLVYGTTGLVNFAHGEMMGWGMLMAYFFNVYGLAGAFGFLSELPAPFGDGVNLIFAVLLATALGALLGWALDKWLFAPLRARGVSLIAQMVVTIGLSILLRYVFLFAFGGVPRFYADFTAQSGIDLGIISITPKDIITALLSLGILIGIGAFLNYTRTGKAMRAVSDNRDLAESSGIDVSKVIRFVWVSGGALAALGGSFIGLSEQVAFNTGLRFLLLIFAGVILGGLGTAYGALVGCLLVGIGIQVSTLFIPTELKNVGALAVLILVLVIKPQGILGRAERIG